MKIKTLLYIFSFVFAAQLISAQNLTTHNNFFKSQIPDFKIWLAQFNVKNTTNFNAPVLSFDTISVYKETQLLLKLKVLDKENWLELNKRTDSLLDKNLSEILIEKLAFQMDLKQEQCLIKIDGLDVKLSIKNKEGKLTTKLMKKMGEVSDGHIVPVGDINNLRVGDKLVIKETISTIEERLEKGLDNYFKKFETTFSKYNFKVLSNLNNKLIIEINNIHECVISENDYFEHIELNFTFSVLNENNNNSINIQYSINAKYAAGIIWSPHLSDYHDANSKYPDEMRKFNLRLKTQIDKIIKQ